MKRKRIILAVAAVFLALFCLALGKSVALAPAGNTLDAGELVALHGRWQPDDSAAAVPGLDAYTYHIPAQLGDNLVLSIEYYWSDVQIYLADRPLASYQDPFREQGVVRQWITLPDDAAGQTLVLYGHADDPFFAQTLVGNSYLGAKNAIFIRFFRDNLYVLLFACFALVLGIAIFWGSYALKRRLAGNELWQVAGLSAFVLLAGLWVVCDSQLLQLFTANTAVVSLLSFLAFMGMPLAMTAFIHGMFPGLQRTLLTLGILFGVNLGCCLTSYLLRLAPMSAFILVDHLLIVLLIILVLRHGAARIRRTGDTVIRETVAGFALLSAFIVAALVLFYLSPGSIYSRLYCIGIVLFALCLTDATFRTLYAQLRKSINAAIYEQLAYEDVMTHMGNRAAFDRDQKKGRSFLPPQGQADLMFDINGLKAVNDAYGHQEGDRLIKDAAACIAAVFASSGRCYRLGGDEFIVIIDGTDHAQIEQALKKLAQAIAQVNRRRAFALQIAWGYALQQETPLSSASLLQLADERMYARKKEMKQG